MREPVGCVAETEGREPTWVGGLGADEEDEEGGDGFCYDVVDG